MASTALLSGADLDTVGEDVRRTDARINAAEQELRGQLVVHVSVQGSGDIGEVLGLILLIKKIERIGDQSKNILYLTETVQISATPRISICSSATDGRSAKCSARPPMFSLRPTKLARLHSGNAARHSRRNSRVTSGI